MADWLDEQLAAAPKPGAKGAPPSEGTSWLDEQLAAAPKAKKEAAEATKPQVSTVDDVVKSAGSGIAKGVVSRAGILGDINELMGLPAYGIGKAAEWAGLVPQGTTERTQQQYREAANKDAQNPTLMGRIEGAFTPMTSHQAIKGVESATGQEFYKPQSTAGRYADNAGSFVGAGAKMTDPRSVALTGAAGVSSEAAGQTAEKAGLNPTMQTVARIAGSLGPQLATRAITPNPISDERKALVNTLDQEGVPLTAGQKTGNRTLQYMESASETAPLGSGRAAEIQQAQREAYTGAAMKRMGEPGKLATPEVLEGAADRFNTTYRDLSNRNTLNMDPKFGQDLGDAVRKYQGLVTDAHQAPVIQNTVSDLISKVVTNGGKIDGPMYQEMRSRLGEAAKSTGDNALKSALKDIQKALDNAMARSISPADADKWKQTNREYANWKTIQPAANAASGAEGTISPALLRSSVARQNANAYSQGKGDLGPLARAGTLMAPLPNSGTAQRAQAMAFPAAIGAAIGSGNPAMLAAAAAPTVASHVVMNPIMQRYLGNQVLRPGAMSTEDKLRNFRGGLLGIGD